MVPIYVESPNIVVFPMHFIFRNMSDVRTPTRYKWNRNRIEGLNLAGEGLKDLVLAQTRYMHLI